jgi:hypothetical protein
MITKAYVRKARWYTKFVPMFLRGFLYTIWPFADILYGPLVEVMIDIQIHGNSLFIKQVPNDTKIED